MGGSVFFQLGKSSFLYCGSLSADCVFASLMGVSLTSAAVVSAFGLVVLSGSSVVIASLLSVAMKVFNRIVVKVVDSRQVNYVIYVVLC